MFTPKISGSVVDWIAIKMSEGSASCVYERFGQFGENN